MDMGSNSWLNTWAILALIAVLALTGLLSGLYPALVYGGRSMLRLFGKTPAGNTYNRHLNFRNTLTAVQFTMVVALLSITFFIYQQMEYVNKMDLGYQKEGVLYFNIDGAEKYKQLAQKLLEIPEIQAVGANGVPGPAMFNQSTYKMKDTDLTFSDGTEQYMSYGTVKTLGLKCDACNLLDNGKDNIYVINQTAAEKLAKAKGIPVEALIGETLVTEPEYENEQYGNGIHHIIDGIIPDYKYFSLKHSSQPLLISISKEPGYVYEMLVRVNTDNMHATQQQIEAAYSTVEATRPIELLFLDERLDQHYADERRSSILLSCLSLVAIAMALMGLAGIVSYMAFTRQKEIGIRKVLGATTSHILLTFNKEYLLLMGVSTAVAMPIALYFSAKWLNGFAYRIEPQWWVVWAAGLLALLLVAAVVTLRTRRAAGMHPSETLRAD
jgi:putative ABC transport system permease protein